MASIRSRVFNKQEIHYTFDQSRPNGGLTQETVEARFSAACALWSPHCGLTFTKTEYDENSPADITIKWGPLENKADGNQKAGETTATAPIVITFNNTLNWTNPLAPPQFPFVAAHELGHAIGMLHSKDGTAVMYDTDTGSSIFVALATDDIVGARYLYEQAPWESNPDNSLNPKTMLLVNQTTHAVDYKIYYNDDPYMSVPVSPGGTGRIETNNSMTYRDENGWDVAHDPHEYRAYKLQIVCQDETYIRDGVSPKAQVAVFANMNTNENGVLAKTGNWGWEAMHIVGSRPVAADRSRLTCAAVGGSVAHRKPQSAVR
jgi:hypothetical protein